MHRVSRQRRRLMWYSCDGRQTKLTAHCDVQRAVAQFHQVQRLGQSSRVLYPFSWRYANLFLTQYTSGTINQTKTLHAENQPDQFDRFDTSYNTGLWWTDWRTDEHMGIANTARDSVVRVNAVHAGTPSKTSLVRRKFSRSRNQPENAWLIRISAPFYAIWAAKNSAKMQLSKVFLH